MSHDVFEDELRTLLRGATEAENPAFHDIDTSEVLGSGRRVVRRRRMAAAGAALAAVTVVGIGSWAALDGSSDRALEVPATRTSAPDGATVETTLRLEGRTTSTVSVRYAPATGALSLVSTDAAGGTTEATAGAVDPTGRTSTWRIVSEDPLVVAGVLPTGAENLLPQWSRDVAGSTSDSAPLAGTPYDAFVIRADDAPGGTTLADLLWTYDQTVHGSPRRLVPSVTVEGRTVFLDPQTSLVGVLDEAATATSPTTAGEPPRVVTARDTSGGRRTTSFVMVLPTGASDVRVEAHPDATVGSSRTVQLPDGLGLVLLAVADAPRTVDDPVAGVTWTAGGQSGSWTASP